MFREMRRKGQQVSMEECIRILNQEKRATLSVNGDDGYPYSVPVNFYYDGIENAIFFHSARTGHKTDSINRSDKVCFMVHDQGYKKDGDWSYFVTSVIIFGRASFVTDKQIKRDKLRLFGLKYFPDTVDVEEELDSGMDRINLVRIDIEHMTGKLVNER